MIVSYARGTMDAEDQAAASPEQTIAAMSSSMDSHECCQAKHKALRRASVVRKTTVEFTQFTAPLPDTGNAMSCCPLTSGSLVVASRSQADDSGSEITQPDSFSLHLQNSHKTSVAIPLRLPNRAHSYLLDCAFLI
jgi:hypothetical protein